MSLGACFWGDDNKPTPTPTPEATAPPASPTPFPCPVDQAICDFVAVVEKLVQARDYPAIAASEPLLENGVRQQAEMAMPTGNPKLVSIGCPFGAVDESCAGYFSLIFTTLAPKDDWTGTSQILILMYQREQAGPRLRLVNGISERETRRAALAGGLAQEPCNISGVASDQTDATCSRSYFHPYSTDGTTFVPIDVSPTNPFVRLLDAPIPPNSALFIATGCWACEGYDRGLQRVVTDGAGNVTVTAVPEPALGPAEQRTSLHVASDGSLIVAATCISSGNCGPLGTPAADAKSRILSSADGGYTWKEEARFDGYATASVSPKGRILVSRTSGSGDPSTWTGSWELLNPAESLKRPFADTYPLFMANGEVAWWKYRDPHVWASDGTVVFDLTGTLTADDSVNSVRFLPDGNALVGWNTGASKPGSPTKSLLGLFTPSGDQVWRHDFAQGAEFGINAVLTPGVAIGNGDLQYPAIGRIPALIDLKAGTVQALTGPFDAPPLQGRNTFEALLHGPFAVVDAPGDCLNIRQDPAVTATVITCAKDQALLYVLGPTAATGDNIHWLRVRTLAGQEGWASDEFLDQWAN
ncbi:MAG: hypothetical protein AB7J35_18680 [Dehalococcoidia bacterium]